MMNEEQTNTESTPSTAPAGEPEVLVVASKVKAYIRAKSGMNTSASVMEALSARVRRLADEAIARAQADGRKTVMDRDFA